VLYFNGIGLVISLLAFGVAWCIGRCTDLSSGPHLLVVCGPLMCILDLWYRWLHRSMFSPSGGGAICWIPAWAWGGFMAVSGAVHLLATTHR